MGRIIIPGAVAMGIGILILWLISKEESEWMLNYNKI